MEAISDTETSQALVLAIGNPLRSDDGVAWVIADFLARLHSLAEMQIVKSQQLMPEMAELVAGAETVVFIDAGVEMPAGEISVSSITAPREESWRMTHQLTPELLLSLAENLYARTPSRVFLLMVGGASFDLSEQLSPEVHEAIPLAVRQIEDLLLPKLHSPVAPVPPLINGRG